MSHLESVINGTKAAAGFINKHIDLKWPAIGGCYNSWSILLNNQDMIDDDPMRLTLTMLGRVAVSYTVGGFYMRQVIERFANRAENYRQAQIYGTGGGNLSWGIPEYAIYRFVAGVTDPLSPVMWDMLLGLAILPPKVHETYTQNKKKKQISEKKLFNFIM